MVVLDGEWLKLLEEMDALEAIVKAWEPCEPDVAALRCEQSRHRTLAHLRAAQETWLKGVLLFAAKDGASLNPPHPWRLFENEGYASRPWEEHREAYLADRAQWRALVRQPDLDRDRGGRLSRNQCTIATLTRRLVYHERHHVSR
jgi:hypothetical protein